MTTLMNIGEAARRSGLPAKTIRYYEEIGLIRPARAANDYRDYSDADIHRLAFLQRSRALGFSIEDCRQLMDLYRDRNRASHDFSNVSSVSRHWNQTWRPSIPCRRLITMAERECI